MSSLVQSGNCEFAIRLAKVLASEHEEGNLFFSPASISLVMAMCQWGARSETEQQIKETLFGKGSTAKEVKEWVENVLALEAHDEEKYATLKFANRLYMTDKCPLRDGFVGQVTGIFKSQAMSVDFKKNASQVASEINQWVKEVTNGKIQKLVPPGCPHSDVALMLINALYFKAPWYTQFCDYNTETKKFHINANEEIDVDMMSMDEEEMWFENEDIQLLQLPYTGVFASMILILPKERYGLRKVLRGYNGKDFLDWLDNSTKERVQIELPKFKIEQSFQLNEQLKNLGMQNAFEFGMSDFSKMIKNGNSKLNISEVLHKAFIEVDENGTEAAAATMVQYVEKCLIERIDTREQKYFIADQPFLFFLTAGQLQNRVILFHGQYYGKDQI